MSTEQGHTLAERLTRGPLDLAEALRLGIAIAEALDQAHRQGTTHGQLTPASILLVDDSATVTGFGAAPLVSEEKASSTISSVVMTRTSTSGLKPIAPEIARYMAPEVFEGEAADPRSDIFAFGAILYEMIAGKPAFDEKTQALLIAAIQTVEPEPISKTVKVPPALEHLIARALAKDPRQRLQTAWDLLVQLRWIAEGGSQVGAAIVAPRRSKRRMAVAVGLAVPLIVAAAGAPTIWARLHPAAEPELVRFTVAGLPPASAVPISMSPDGHWLLGSPGGSGTRGVIALALDSVNTQPLIPANNVTQPFWSPDGRSVAFFEDAHLKRIDIAGGAARNICETPVPIGGGTWNADGTILFAAGGVIHRVVATGGQPTAITTLDKAHGETEHMGPSFLPDGKHFLFFAGGRDSGVYVASIDSQERKKLFAADSRPVYAAPGYILFNRAGIVFAQAFDAQTLTLTGEAQRVVDGVATLAQGPNASPVMPRTANFTVSQNGILAFKSAAAGAGSTATEEPRTLMWLDSNGNVAGQVAATGTYEGVDFSPDGTRFAVHRHEAAGGDVWTYDIAERRFQRFTFDTSQDNSSPIWSPDGSRIAYTSLRRNNWGIYVKASNGNRSEELVVESTVPKAVMSWSADGKAVVYQENGDIWMMPIGGDGKPIALVVTSANEVFPQVSPDGKWLAYQSNESGANEIYVQPFPSGAGKWQVSTDGGVWPRWSGDSAGIYFVAAPNVVLAPIRVNGNAVVVATPRPVLTLSADPTANTPHPNGYSRYAVSRDGRYVLLGQPAGVGGAAAGGGIADRIAALADGGTGVTGIATNLTVIVNWPKLLKRN